MKKLAILGLFVLFFGSAAWTFRTPLAIAALRSSPDNGVLWDVVVSNAHSRSAQDFARDHVLETHARWCCGERVQFMSQIRPAVEVLRMGPPLTDVEVCRALIAAYLTRVECSRSQGLRAMLADIGTLISDARETEHVTRAIVEFIGSTAPGRQDEIARALVPLLDELHRREHRNDAAAVQAVARHALTHGVSIEKYAGFTRALKRLAEPSVRAAAWQAALAEIDGVKRGPKHEWLIRFVFDELRLAQVALSDAVIAKVLAISAAADRRDPKKGRSPIADACLDLALQNESFSTGVIHLATAGDGATPTGYVRDLRDEVARLRARGPAEIVAHWTRRPASYAGTPVRKRDRAAGFLFRGMRVSRALARDARLLGSAGGDVVGAADRAFASNNRDAVWLGAKVLATLDPRRLAGEVERRIDAFVPVAARFSSRRDYDHHAFFHAGVRIEEGLLALARVDGGPEFLYPWLRALSIPEAGFSRRAAEMLKARLNACEFTDAMFGFLAVRPRYTGAEIDVYVSTLVSYDGIGEEIERKMSELLTAAQRPERVGWVFKLIGLRALAETGGSTSLRVLERYAADPSTYRQTGRSTDRSGRVQWIRRSFRHLAKNAVSRVRARGTGSETKDGG